MIFSVTAQADILFLNLNNAPDEIRAAERAAKKRNEKLVVIPAPDPATSRKVDELSKKYVEATTRWVAALNSSNDELSSRSMREMDKLALEKQTYKVSEDQLFEKMQKASKGRKFTSMIISGHDGNGSFSGDLASFRESSMVEALKALGPAGESIQALYLWGCYTTTPGSILAHWKKALPQARLLVGFEGSGPLKDNPQSQRILEDSLKRESAMIAAKDVNDLKKLAFGIRSFNSRDTAICRDDDIVSKRKGGQSLSALKQECDQFAENPLYQKYLCYFNADPGCENVPKDTAAGELRRFYVYVQDVEHCREVWEGAGVRRELPNLATVQRLLFYDTVKQNFAAAHRTDLNLFDEAAKELGFPESLRLSDVAALPRSELKRRIHTLREKLNETIKADDYGINPATRYADGMLKALRQFDDTILRLEPKCALFDWVENHPTQSKCLRGTADQVRNPSSVHALVLRRENDALSRIPEYHQLKSEIRERSNQFRLENDRIYFEISALRRSSLTDESRVRMAELDSALARNRQALHSLSDDDQAIERKMDLRKSELMEEDIKRLREKFPNFGGSDLERGMIDQVQYYRQVGASQRSNEVPERAPRGQETAEDP